MLHVYAILAYIMSVFTLMVVHPILGYLATLESSMVHQYSSHHLSYFDVKYALVFLFKPVALTHKYY